MKAWKNQFSGTFKVFHSRGKVSIPPHSYSEQAWEALWRLGSTVGLGCFEQVLAETCRKEKEWSMCMWAIVGFHFQVQHYQVSFIYFFSFIHQIFLEAPTLCPVLCYMLGKSRRKHRLPSLYETTTKQIMATRYHREFLKAVRDLMEVFGGI